MIRLTCLLKEVEMQHTALRSETSWLRYFIVNEISAKFSRQIPQEETAMISKRMKSKYPSSPNNEEAEDAKKTYREKRAIVFC